MTCTLDNKFKSALLPISIRPKPGFGIGIGPKPKIAKVSLYNVCSLKKDTKRSSVLLLGLVSFFTEQTLQVGPDS